MATSTVAPPVVPPTASGVVGTLTVVTPTQSGSLTAYAAGTLRPNTSNLNFGAPQTIANLAVVAGPAWAIRNNCAAPTHVLLDVSGYFS
ncbi:hypothetical protein ABIB25_003218 [Nakamurella sp. UYEF19]|uniref:hypothetical protein n=1 Tax=Nakamurella sp. UYEF19 TaxID=1756392 RepID=UPI003398845F